MWLYVFNFMMSIQISTGREICVSVNRRLCSFVLFIQTCFFVYTYSFNFAYLRAILSLVKYHCLFVISFFLCSVSYLVFISPPNVMLMYNMNNSITYILYNIYTCGVLDIIIACQLLYGFLGFHLWQSPTTSSSRIQ